LAAEQRLTLGSAGHIDHGKTALVEALTGKLTDRLAEERRRGISIELGFAELRLPSGPVSVVDVPGHERLVRTMVSGATGIDFFLLVVAADDGPMPQTHEHLTVLRALGIERGVVALTKWDLVDADRRAHVVEAARALVPGAPVVAVSARTGEGLEALVGALDRVAAAVPRRSDDGGGWPPIPVLHVDRAFTLKGVGTIVTGTLRGGALSAGERVRILPRGLNARVRGLETHDRQVDPALPGSRVAVNLGGVDHREVERGDVLTVADAPLRPSYRLDVAVPPTLAETIQGERVQVHHGTRHAAARVVAISSDLVQLRLEAPLIAMPGDRLVLRAIAPPTTFGGGVIVDPVPPRHGGRAAPRLELIRRGSPEELLRAAADADPRIVSQPIERWLSHPVLGPAARRFPPDVWRRAAAEIAAEIRPPAPSRAEPAAPSPRALAALELLEADGMRPRSVSVIAEALGLTRSEAAGALDELARAGTATRAGAELYFATGPFEVAREAVLELARRRGSVSIAETRSALGTGRKHAQALLELMDAQKLTLRRGDRRVIRGTATATTAQDAGEPQE
jgi:selenocysteine-specific elongation factor